MKHAPVSKVICQNPRYDNKRVISWSDIVAIEAGRYPQSIPPNRKMLFGTYIHDLIEKDQLKKKLGVMVTRGNRQEVPLKYKRFVGRLDSDTDEEIIDYKTCSEHWKFQQAKDHDQLRFYAYLKWKSEGILPKQYRIVSLETSFDENNELTLTGSVKEWVVPINIPDLLKVKARADRAILKLRRDLGKS